MRLFFDMDGTLAKWLPESTMEDLLKEGYFRDLPDNGNMPKAVKELIDQGCEVYLLSAALEDSVYARKEKREWAKRHFPFIQEERILLVPYGTPKTLYVPDGVRKEDVLIGDYSENLRDWAKYGTAIKCLNGINGTKGTWKGHTVKADAEVMEITALIKAVCCM